MCPPHLVFRIGYQRVRRPAVRFRRIHAFAAERWADAKTPGAMKFWKAVMDRSVKHVDEWQPIPGFWEAWDQQSK